MAATRKPKSEQLREARQQRENTPQPAVSAPQQDFSSFKRADTTTVSLRFSHGDKERLERLAADRGVKLSQLLRMWILERANKRE